MRYTIRTSYTAMSLRTDHTAFAPKTGSMYVWQSAQGDEIWTATDSVAGVRAIGDQWLHVKMIGTAAVDGWIAIVHLGKVYCTVTDSGVVVVPPPVGTVFPKSIDVYYDDGTMETFDLVKQ